MPKHYRAVLKFRSSSARRYNYIIANGVGEIEWNYSDEWMGVVYPLENARPIPAGTRVFQFHIEPVWDAPWWIKVSHLFCKFKIKHVEELSTNRNGLGSSGN